MKKVHTWECTTSVCVYITASRVAIEEASVQLGLTCQLTSLRRANSLAGRKANRPVGMHAAHVESAKLRAKRVGILFLKEKLALRSQRRDVIRSV